MTAATTTRPLVTPAAPPAPRTDEEIALDFARLPYGDFDGLRRLMAEMAALWTEKRRAARAAGEPPPIPRRSRIVWGSGGPDRDRADLR